MHTYCRVFGGVARLAAAPDVISSPQSVLNQLFSSLCPACQGIDLLFCLIIHRPEIACNFSLLTWPVRRDACSPGPEYLIVDCFDSRLDKYTLVTLVSRSITQRNGCGHGICRFLAAMCPDCHGANLPCMRKSICQCRTPGIVRFSTLPPGAPVSNSAASTVTSYSHTPEKPPQRKIQHPTFPY